MSLEVPREDNEENFISVELDEIPPIDNYYVEGSLKKWRIRKCQGIIILWQK